MTNFFVFVGSFVAASTLFYFGWRVVRGAVARENAVKFEEWERI